MSDTTFVIIESPMALGGQAITCLCCGLTSHNPNDVAERYCGNCHRFHEVRPGGEAT